MTIALAFKLANLARHPYNCYMGVNQEQTFLEKIQKVFEEAIDEESAWRKERYKKDDGFISKKHIDRFGEITCFCLSVYSIKLIFDVTLHILKNIFFSVYRLLCMFYSRRRHWVFTFRKKQKSLVTRYEIQWCEKLL